MSFWQKKKTKLRGIIIVCVWPVSKSGIKLIPFSCMMEKRGIRSLSEGICTHLSSVRLIRILPSVENTIKDIRNCGLRQERKYSLLAQWSFLDTCFPTMRYSPPLPYKFMSEVLNKVVDFGPVMLHTARSKKRKARLVWGWFLFFNHCSASEQMTIICASVQEFCFSQWQHFILCGHSYTFLSRFCAELLILCLWFLNLSTVGQ